MHIGPIRYFNDVAQRTSVSGVATGLAWTTAGGDILYRSDQDERKGRCSTFQVPWVML